MIATLTPERIADYLGKAELADEVVSYNWSRITLAIARHWPEFEFTPEIISEAVEIARADALVELARQDITVTP